MFPVQYGTPADDLIYYLSLESVKIRVFRFDPRYLQRPRGTCFYGIMENERKKYMKNTNISCIGVDSVASYGCKGMTLRH